MSSSEMTSERTELQQIERALEALGGQATPAALMAGPLQELMAAAVRLSVSCLEQDPDLRLLEQSPDMPSATDVLMTVSALLAAVDVEPFELGLWATWGIRGGSETERDDT